MFDIGFAELLMVGVVGLIVLGPEKLPKAVRTLGLWVGRIRRSVGSIQREINEELRVDELKRSTAMSQEQLNKTLGDVTENFQRPFGEDSPTQQAAPEAPKAEFDPTAFTGDASVHEAYKPVPEEPSEETEKVATEQSEPSTDQAHIASEQLEHKQESNEQNKHS